MFLLIWFSYHGFICLKLKYSFKTGYLFVKKLFRKSMINSTFITDANYNLKHYNFSPFSIYCTFRYLFVIIHLHTRTLIPSFCQHILNFGKCTNNMNFVTWNPISLSTSTLARLYSFYRVQTALAFRSKTDCILFGLYYKTRSYNL